MFKSINEEKKTFTNKVVEQIKDVILSGELVPGDKLPSERHLAEMMNVSRPTIREACKILSAMGLVTIKQGSGVIVADQGTRIDNLASFLFLRTDSIHELFEVRRILETEIAEWAAKRGTNEFLKEILTKTEETYEKVVVQNEFESKEEREVFLSASDQEFHLMIAEAAGNEVILRIMNNLIDLLNKSRMQSMKIPGRVEQSLIEHISIARGLNQRDGKLARKSMIEHLSSVEKDLVKELKQQSREK